MIHVPDTTASTLTSVIKDMLICCVLPLENFRGQAYDGASNTMGHVTGVVNPFPGEYVWAFICIFTKINILFILESTGVQQVPLDSTKTTLPYEGGLVA